MTARTALTLEVHVLDVETGIWCDHCMLPSVARASLAVVHPSTLRIVGRGQYAACQDCGATP